VASSAEHERGRFGTAPQNRVLAQQAFTCINKNTGRRNNREKSPQRDMAVLAVLQ
jgi:hypothetical protein